jgi:uncharacterized protein YdhG (YjbR/CyaY superfamily)
MSTSNTKFNDVDEYISSCHTDVQPILKRLRTTIRKAAPDSDERISYGMPFYEYGGKGYKGRLVYFAAFKKHISLFITPKQNETVPKELQEYHISKATYQFPLGKPLPFDLIATTVKALVRERDLHIASGDISKDVLSYHAQQATTDKEICDLLFKEINICLPKAESKIWHGHPVWFLDGNPIVGYSKQKAGIRLMFWSGASFDEQGLDVRGKKFNDASIFYNAISDINTKDLKRWLKKSKEIQWDYKNVVRRKGKLERLT